MDTHMIKSDNNVTTILYFIIHIHECLRIEVIDTYFSQNCLSNETIRVCYVVNKTDI